MGLLFNGYCTMIKDNNSITNTGDLNGEHKKIYKQIPTQINSFNINTKLHKLKVKKIHSK
ncbi:hypothetical protein BHO_0124900 (plasmid) [Borrelia hermsii YBT]|uniref:Uncharacterized protein n=1 Tax=Borrelia hermsii YBT TaxID=1313295 RepID=W5T316_BORHE|nr:hypothetical protein BHO_0124900 [Borrelia hermsii YBT]